MPDAEGVNQMPTNEELKKALECLVKGQKRAGVCAKCAYRKGVCYVTVPRHALERIRELEAKEKQPRRKSAKVQEAEREN